MGRFWIDRPPRRPGAAAAARRRRHRPPAVCPLEARELMAITGLSDPVVSLQILTPPDGRFVPVDVSGILSNNLESPPITELHVIDEYRRINTVRRLPLARRPETNAAGDPLYDYSFTVALEASRADQDRSGRHYYLIITARDADSAAARIIPVRVPHDRGQLPAPADDDGAAVESQSLVLSPPRPPRRLRPGSGPRTGRRGGPR